MLYNECQVASGCTTLLSVSPITSKISYGTVCKKAQAFVKLIHLLCMYYVVPFGAGMIKWTLDMSA